MVVVTEVGSFGVCLCVHFLPLSDCCAGQQATAAVVVAIAVDVFVVVVATAMLSVGVKRLSVELVI